MVLKCAVKLAKLSFDGFVEAITSFDSQLAKTIIDSSVISADCVTIPANQVLSLQKQQLPFCLHDFIDPSSFEIVSIAKEVKKNPQLLARLDKLRWQEERRQYDELVSNVAKPYDSSAPTESIATELRALDRQIIGILNFVLTVAGATVFGYKAPELLWGIDDPLPRLFLAIFCGAIVFIADIYFLIVRGA